MIIGEKADEISRETGISPDKLKEPASHSDLARLYGVGPVFAGIDSVESFVKHSASQFIEIYENRTNKKADFSESDISFSIDLAKELTRNK